MTRTTARLTSLAAALVAGALTLTGCGDATNSVHDSMSSSDTSASAQTSA